MSERTTAVDRRTAQRIRPSSRKRSRDVPPRSERCEPAVAHRRWLDTVRICNLPTFGIAIALLPWRRGEVLRHEISLLCRLQGLALNRSMAHGTGFDDVMDFVPNVCRMCLGDVSPLLGPGQGFKVLEFARFRWLPVCYLAVCVAVWAGLRLCYC